MIKSKAVTRKEALKDREIILSLTLLLKYVLLHSLEESIPLKFLRMELVRRRQQILKSEGENNHQQNTRRETVLSKARGE